MIRNDMATVVRRKSFKLRPLKSSPSVETVIIERALCTPKKTRLLKPVKKRKKNHEVNELIQKMNEFAIQIAKLEEEIKDNSKREVIKEPLPPPPQVPSPRDDSKEELAQHHRRRRLQRRTFGEWATWSIKCRVAMREVRDAAREMRKLNDVKLLRCVFEAMRLRRLPLEAAAKKIERLEAARQAARERDLRRGIDIDNPVLLPEQIEAEETRLLYKQSTETRRRWLLTHHLHALSEAIRLKQEREAYAIRFHGEKLCKKPFDAWRRSASLATEGESADCESARRRQLRYRRQRRVDKFEKQKEAKAKRRAFEAMKRFYDMARSELILLKRRAAASMSAAMSAWQTKRNRRLEIRRVVVDAWRKKCRTIVERPLKAWLWYARMEKQNRKNQDHVLRVRAAARQRRLCFKVFRTWRHQAVYGRVDGMYTRSDLLRYLEEARAQAQLLESKTVSAKSECEVLAREMDEQRRRIGTLEREIDQHEEQNTQLRFAVHNGEHDLKKVAALMEELSRVNPKGLTKAMRSVLLDKVPFAVLSPPDEGSRLPACCTAPAPSPVVEDAFESQPQSSSKLVRKEDESLARVSEDEDKALLTRRAKWVVAHPKIDFRRLTQLGGVELYRVPPEGGREEQASQIFGEIVSNDLKETFALWDFLATGDQNHLDESLAQEWKKAQYSGELDEPWTNDSCHRPPTISGNRLLPTWGEFNRALKRPGYFKV